MKHIKSFNQINESRIKVNIGGYEQWVDVEKQVIYDSETAKHGQHYTSDNSTYVHCSKLSKEEKIQLLNAIKSK